MIDTLTTSQGQAWDQAALERLGSEKLAGKVMEVNISEMDALLFPGGTVLKIPDIPVIAVKSLPPWERM